MITAQERDDFVVINHILCEPEETEVQSESNMRVLLRETHMQTHRKAHTLTCADILDRHNYKSTTQW